MTKIKNTEAISNDPFLDIVYVGFDDGGNSWEESVIEFDYFEWHSICEALKMTQNYIRKQIIMGEGYGWEEDVKSPINKVSPNTIQKARAKATHVRKVMAALYQNNKADIDYDPKLFDDERDMPSDA